MKAKCRARQASLAGKQQGNVLSMHVPKAALPLGLLALVLGSTSIARADPFTPPTPAELAMTSLPGYPGAAAAVLYREQITRDDLHVEQHYDRIKILTEVGKKYANVELSYYSTENSDDRRFADFKTVDTIVGRTIHPDGTIIAFTGKPYNRVLEQTSESKHEAMVFTLPDVEVGSIIEYRYSTRISDHVYEPPRWFIQGDLYIESAHFVWYPSTRPMIDPQRRAINAISWYPILPPGVHVNAQTVPSPNSYMPASQLYQVDVTHVPPNVKEDHMLPLSNTSYRVLFAFTPFHSGEDFWKSEGKDWAKREDSFAEPSAELRSATQAVTAGATSDEDKLRRIYAFVMTMENTRYTRERESRADQAEEGPDKIKVAADVLSHKRGTPAQLAGLFVGMARITGLKAYLMLVPDRGQRLFTPVWLNFNQFGATIAIVNVSGHEEYFDPGWRYCRYGHLAWEHSFVQGLREIDGGTEFARTVGDSFKDNQTTRIASLSLDASGTVKGTITLSFEGEGALNWRHVALRGDQESLKNDLQKNLKKTLSRSLEVVPSDIQNLQEYEKPLIVRYEVTGSLGNPTGKRMVVPADVFEAGASTTFPHATRQNTVYFHYPFSVQDMVRVTAPADVTVEASPAQATYALTNQASYQFNVTAAPATFTTRRSYILGTMLFPVKDYPQLQTFYSQFESKDQETVVLKTAAAQTTSGTAAN